MQKPIYQIPQNAQGRLQQDQPPSHAQHPPELLQRRAGVAQMMEHIHHKQVGQRFIAKAQSVSILYPVDPGKGEQIGSHAIRDHLMNAADARTRLYVQTLPSSPLSNKPAR